MSSEYELSKYLQLHKRFNVQLHSNRYVNIYNLYENNWQEKYLTKSPTKGNYICVEIPLNIFFQKIFNKLTKIVVFQSKIKIQTKGFWNLFEIEVIDKQTK